MYKSPIFLNAGDKAMVVELGDSINPEVNRLVHSLNNKISSFNINGIIDSVPSYKSILIMFDPLQISSSEIQSKIANELESIQHQEVNTQLIVHVPTLYGGDFGPDLSFVSKHTNIDEPDVIDLHSSKKYLVYMMGFSPGFPYLGGLPSELETPRLDTPRPKISGGSVGIADKQTGIYPNDSPGGWRIIGRTPIKLFDQNKTPPTLLIPGNYLKFDPLPDLDSYLELQSNYQNGSFEPNVEKINEK